MSKRFQMPSFGPHDPRWVVTIVRFDLGETGHEEFIYASKDVF